MQRIRVLWIDDYSELPAYPSLALPAPLDRWFELVASPECPAPLPSTDSVIALLKSFFRPGSTWSDGPLPSEICVFDYNLAKRTRGAEVPASDASIMSEPQEPEMGEGASIVVGRRQQTDVNFEGLLLGQFLGALMFQHPMGLVPITRYAHRMGPAVEALERITEPFLSVDFQLKGDGPTQWPQLLQRGAQLLRTQMLRLAEAQMVAFDVTALVAIRDATRLAPILPAVSFSSHFAERSLPLEGLFVDHMVSSELGGEESGGAHDATPSALPESGRHAAREWAGAMLRHVWPDDAVEAEAISEQTWRAYASPEMPMRYRLSELAREAIEGRLDSDSEEAELQELCRHFGVAVTPAPTAAPRRNKKGPITIASPVPSSDGGDSGRSDAGSPRPRRLRFSAPMSNVLPCFLGRGRSLPTRRLATLMLLLRFWKHVQHARTSARQVMRMGIAQSDPVVGLIDVYMLLDPLPGEDVLCFTERGAEGAAIGDAQGTMNNRVKACELHVAYMIGQEPIPRKWHRPPTRSERYFLLEYSISHLGLRLVDWPTWIR